MRYVHWFLITDICIALFFVTLSILALTNRGYRLPSNRVFVGIAISMLVWLVTNQISNDISNSPHVAIVANYFLFSASFIMTILTVRLVTMITNDALALKFIHYTEWLMWIMAVVSATPLVGAGVILQDNVYAVDFGPFAGLYGGLLTCMIVVIFWVTIKNWNHHVDMTRSQVRTVGASLLITAPLVLSLGFVIPYLTDNFTITQISLVPMVIFAFALYTGVIRHRLFDVKLVAIRTLAYALSIATMAVIYFGLAYVVSELLFANSSATGVGVGPISIILALLLAFIFQPIKTFFDKATDRIFFRDRYETDEFLANIGKIITDRRSLSGLIDGIADSIVLNIKSEHVTFVVFSNEKLVSLRGSHQIQLEDDVRDELRRVFADLSKPVLTKNEINNLTHQNRLHQKTLITLHKNNIEIAMLLNDNLGYVLLGQQQASGYSSRDYKVLTTLAGELSVAIHNALSVEEIRTLNHDLQKRIDSATSELRASNEKLLELDKVKDEFISMASHQLRTPLTSIKGYVSMVLDGDAGKINKHQKQLLDEAFLSSDRMGRLISDFLNISRLQTGKFILDTNLVDMTKVVGQEVETLAGIASRHDIKLLYTPPKTEVMADVDEDKIRQVIMNFVDNAIYYSRPHSVIVVKLYTKDSSAFLEVHDQGIGVPHSVQKKLFTKFFRAENARTQRPDGTGVGLFLAKKVIEAHKGEILFHSTEGKGSMFGFRLKLHR